MFAQDTPALLDGIRRAIAGGDGAEVMREAHTLKGSLKVLGATKAAQLAQDLEALGRAGDGNGAREMGPILEREVERILQCLPMVKQE